MNEEIKNFEAEKVLLKPTEWDRDDSFYIDFKDDYDLSCKMTDIINDIAKKAAHYEDREFLTGFSLLSKRKKRRINKWVFKALKKQKEDRYDKRTSNHRTKKAR